MLSLLALVGLVAGASLVGVGAAASAQELSIPVMVQTRPAIPGARFALDGTEFVANQHGLAVTTVVAPGTYELAVSSPTIEVEGASHSFSVWTGGERVFSRPLEVDSFTLLEAGFDTTRAVSFGFTDQNGTAIESGRIDHATIVESDGDTRYRINQGQPTPVVASRAVPNATGVTVLPVSYRLIEAVVDGRPVSGMESGIEAGVDSAVSISVALPTDPGDQPAKARDEQAAPDSSPPESNSRSLSVVVGGVFLAILSSLFIVLAGAWLQRRRPRHQTGRAGDAAPLPGQPEDAEWSPAGNQYLRVHMSNDRIVDGWTRPISQPVDDQVLHLVRVQHVYNRDGDEVASTPLDVFLVRSQIARIEHIDASTAPPPSTRPTADVVRLEEDQPRKQRKSKGRLA